MHRKETLLLTIRNDILKYLKRAFSESNDYDNTIARFMKFIFTINLWRQTLVNYQLTYMKTSSKISVPLAMSKHKRLGGESIIKDLPVDVLRMIKDYSIPPPVTVVTNRNKLREVFA